MGQALKDGYRHKAFVMTKFDARTAKEYDKQLEQSMGRLDTGVIDLVQFHEILRFEDLYRIFADDGAIHAAMAARAAGKIRYIGFTGHKDPQIHLRMFEVAAQHSFHFDTVQMPVNAMDAHFRSFTHHVIPVAQRAGTGILGMKTFGDGYILRSGTIDPMEALHYGLTQLVSVFITGIDKPEILTRRSRLQGPSKLFTPEQTATFLAKTKDAAMTGKFEPLRHPASLTALPIIPNGSVALPGPTSSRRPRPPRANAWAEPPGDFSRNGSNTLVGFLRYWSLAAEIESGDHLRASRCRKLADLYTPQGAETRTSH
jgi:Aldo/keto reductase family